ncbi:MAG: transcriptional regulator [Actinomycetia bacterium]|nr:transcriptional regulator [Actinomycetes bacterium]
MTAPRLAELAGVSRNSLVAWRGNAGIRPRAQHQLAVAKVLEMPAHTLWPTGSERSVAAETVKVWPGLNEVPTELWSELTLQCVDQFDVVVGSPIGVIRWILPIAAKVFPARAEAGDPVSIRIINADPDGAQIKQRQETESEFDPSIGGTSQKDLAKGGRDALDQWVEQLGALKNCEIRTTDHPEIYTAGIFRFDDQAITYPYYMGVRGLASVTRLIKRIEVGGEFDALARQADRVWNTGTPYRPSR